MSRAQLFSTEVEEQRRQRLEKSGYPAGYWESDKVFALSTSLPLGVRVSLPVAGTTDISAVVPFSVIERARSAAEESKSSYWALDLLGCYLAHAAAEDGVNGYEWTVHKVGNGLPRFSDVVDMPHPHGSLQNGADSVITAHSRNTQILRRLRDGGSVVIDGRTGSGKSGQTALIAHLCVDDGIQRIDLDLVDMDDSPESVLSALITLPAPRGGWYLLVIENMHASPGTAEKVFQFVATLREKHHLRIAVLANGWLELTSTRESLRFLAGALTVRTEPGRVIEKLADAAGLSPRQLDGFRRLTGDGQDITLAHLAWAYFRDHGEIPTPEEFTEHTAREFGLTGELAVEVRECLYEFACLGSFDIEIPMWLRLKYEQHERPFGRLIERADTTYRIGSRSVAREVARYLYRRWKDDPDHPLPHPADKANRQLAAIGDPLIRSQLERLDLIHLTRQGGGQAGQRLANIWSLHLRMVDLLVRKANDDPEWGDNAASAAFAAMALYRLERTDEADGCARFVRERWDPFTSPALPTWIGTDASAEARDIRNLQHMMRLEDEQRAQAAGSGDDRRWQEELRSEHIDLDKMHRTWMLGVLLSFEAADPAAQDDRVDALHKAADEAWKQDGCFYPARIPWVTARVLIGLCEAGLSESPVASRAAEWLLSWKEPPDAKPMGWSSGTGAWNTKAMTNAMCLIALLKQGRVRKNDPRINVGYNSMLIEMGKQPDATRDPIDYGLIIEALLMMNGLGADRTTAYEKLTDLLYWVSQSVHWDSPRDERTALGGTAQIQVESTELPFTASQIVGCVRGLAAIELDKLYREMIDGSDESEEPGGNAVPEPEPGPAPEGAAPPAPAQVAEISAELMAKVRRAAVNIRTMLDEQITSRRRALRTMEGSTQNPAKAQSQLWQGLASYEGYERRLDELDQVLETGPITKALVVEIDDLGVAVGKGSYVRCIPDEEAAEIRRGSASAPPPPESSE